MIVNERTIEEIKSTRKAKKFIVSDKIARRLVGLKISAFDDYLSARVLFCNNLLLQACFFANSALEKEMKVILEFNEFPITVKHKTDKLFDLIKKDKPQLAAKINKEFIEQLSKIYRARYPDSLSPGFNFTIVRNKYLCELDYTYTILEDAVILKSNKSEELDLTKYKNAINTRDPRLIAYNYLFNNVEKSNFLTLNNRDRILEFRILFNHSILEMMYDTTEIKNDNVFKYEALKPASEDNRSYQHSHMPVRD